MNLFNKIVVHLCIISLVVASLMSCSIESYYTKKVAADNEIKAYITENEYEVMPDSLGLVYIPLLKGNGKYPQKGDKVAFHYIGYYLNGDVFDSSYDRAYPLIVELGNGQMIKGMESALLKMDKGAKSKIIVPFYLAYDDMENAPVMPFSNLVFELELIDIDSRK